MREQSTLTSFSVSSFPPLSRWTLLSTAVMATSEPGAAAIVSLVGSPGFLVSSAKLTVTCSKQNGEMCNHGKTISRHFIYCNSLSVKSYIVKNVFFWQCHRTLTISHNWPVRPVHLQREFHYQSELSSQISLFLHSMHSGDRFLAKTLKRSLLHFQFDLPGWSVLTFAKRP